MAGGEQPRNRVLALNARKGDLTLEQLGWPLRTVDESSWDGLSGFYRDLWEIADKPADGGHPQWLRALG